jgi:putative heme iron utilization protein
MEQKDINSLLLLEVRDDVKAIRTDIQKIEILDAIQNAHLEAHMARTKANEDRLEKLEDFKWYFAALAVFMTVAIETIRRIY